MIKGLLQLVKPISILLLAVLLFASGYSLCLWRSERGKVDALLEMKERLAAAQETVTMTALELEKAEGLLKLQEDTLRRRGEEYARVKPNTNCFDDDDLRLLNEAGAGAGIPKD